MLGRSRWWGWPGPCPCSAPRPGAGRLHGNALGTSVILFESEAAVQRVGGLAGVRCRPWQPAERDQVLRVVRTALVARDDLRVVASAWTTATYEAAVAGAGRALASPPRALRARPVGAEPSRTRGVQSLGNGAARDPLAEAWSGTFHRAKLRVA
jgi:hypothetical protein